jgi:hypothetical protein
MSGIPLGKIGSRSLGKFVPTEATPVNAVAAQGLLTVATKATAGDTFTIDTTTYTFVAEDATPVAGQLKIGTDVAGTRTNILAALKGTDSVNTAHATVTPAAAWATAELTLTAVTAGVSGNSIATTETFNAVGNILDATTLGTERAGVNGTSAPAGAFRYDDSYLYIALATNDVSGANWRRISIGSAY